MRQIVELFGKYNNLNLYLRHCELYFEMISEYINDILTEERLLNQYFIVITMNLF